MRRLIPLWSYTEAHYSEKPTSLKKKKKVTSSPGSSTHYFVFTGGMQSIQTLTFHL